VVFNINLFSSFFKSNIAISLSSPTHNCLVFCNKIKEYNLFKNEYKLIIELISDNTLISPFLQAIIIELVKYG